MCCGNIFGGSFFDSFISFVVLSNRGSAADFGNQDYEKSAKRKCEKIIFAYSNSTKTNAFCLGIILCNVSRSFDYFGYDFRHGGQGG